MPIKGGHDTHHVQRNTFDMKLFSAIHETLPPSVGKTDENQRMPMPLREEAEKGNRCDKREKKYISNTFKSAPSSSIAPPQQHVDTDKMNMAS